MHYLGYPKLLHVQFDIATPTTTILDGIPAIMTGTSWE
jgi:hypothetical protein